MVSLPEQHAHHSILRERILEHWLVGEIMRRLWMAGRTDIEVLRSEFDRGGYDLLLDLGGTVRHVQLKASRRGGTTSEVTVSLELARRPSGCVIWVVVDDDLCLDHFRWFGGPPGESLPSVSGLQLPRQTRANAQGLKAEKANFRRLPGSLFTRLHNVDELLDRLFSAAWRKRQEPPTVAGD
jgi:hypothetical protein